MGKSRENGIELEVVRRGWLVDRVRAVCFHCIKIWFRCGIWDGVVFFLEK